MTKKILIIDDEPAVVTYLSTLLQDHGYETSSSLNADEGYRIASEENPDLITLDLLMPEKTGIRLYKELKKNERLREIPVIMVTGFTSQQFPMIDFKKFIYERSIPGPEAFIEKPVDPDELLSIVSTVLEASPTSSAQ
jgi:CheY-like chemotaxis protein